MDLSIPVFIKMYNLLLFVLLLCLFSSEVLRLCRDTFRCGEKFNYSIRCLWLNRAWHVQAGMAELTRFLYATVQRHSTKAQYKGTVQGHSTKAHYKGTIKRHSTKTQYKGTIQRHSTQSQYKGTVQRQCTKSQYIDTVQRRSTQAQYKCKQQ